MKSVFFYLWSDVVWNRITTISMAMIVLAGVGAGCVIIYNKLKKEYSKDVVIVTNYSKVNQAIHADMFSLAASVALNADGEVIGVNKRAQKLFGWREEELKGKSMAKVLTEDSAIKFETHKRERSITTPDDEIVEIELEAITRVEEKKVLRVSVGRWTDDLDIYFIVSAIDITHRKKNEEAIKAAEKEINYLRRIYHEGEKVGNVCFWEMDCKTGRIQYSPNFANMYAVKGVEITADILIKRVIADDRVRIAETMRDAKDNKHGYEMEYRFAGLDGYINTMHSIAKAVKNQQGELTHFIGMGRLVKKEKPKWL